MATRYMVHDTGFLCDVAKPISPTEDAQIEAYLALLREHSARAAARTTTPTADTSETPRQRFERHFYGRGR